MSRARKDRIMEEGTQPTGLELSKTLWVVNEMLTSPEFCEEVKDNNGWPKDMSSDRAALLFLAARYQSTVALLVRRTDFLNAQVDGAMRRVVALEDSVFSTE